MLRSTAPPPRAWEFRGSAGARTREERDRFVDRLSASLRAAAGWPVDLTLRWNAGPAPSVRLHATDLATARWVAGSLVPAYPPGAWVATSREVGGGGPTVAVGRSLGGPERPFRTVGPLTSPWADSVGSALFLLPAGTVEWRLRPLGPSPAVGPPPPSLVRQPTGFRSETSTTVARRFADELADRSVAPRWDVRGRIRATNPDSARVMTRLVGVSSREDGGNGIGWRWTGRWLGRSPPPIVLSVPELLGFWPSPSLRLPGGAEGSPSSMRTLILGRTETGSPSGLPVEPGQGRHALFLGETGMGKSTALLRAAVRASELGSVVFFDPVGDTSRRLLDRLPASALDRVVWISPALSPVGLNALAPASRPGPSGERAVGDLVSALRRVRAGRYADSPFWGPRLDEMLTLALRAAAAYPDGTLRDADAILASVGGRLVGVPPSAERAVRELVDRVRARPEEVDGARRVLGEVARSPVLARLLASPRGRFSLGEGVRSGRIVLISGDAPEVGESVARVLLSVLLALLWVELLEGTKGKTFVLLDELQWYANDAVAELLRLGRRFNIHLYAATQSLGSLPEPIREALLTNVADLVAFRGSPDDARELARWVPDLPAESILRLRRGEAAALLGKGEQVGWLRLPTDADRPRPDRWRATWEQCRGLWASAEEIDVPAPPTTGPADGREMLLLLWAGVLASGPESAVTVRLDDLRDELRADDASIRAVGQRLASAGALTAFDDAGARTWTVRRDRLAPLLSDGVDPAELARADARWARLRQRGLNPDSRKRL